MKARPPPPVTVKEALMYTVECSRLGFCDCSFVGEAESVALLKELMFAHALVAHEELLTSFTLERHQQIERIIDELLAAQRAAEAA